HTGSKRDWSSDVCSSDLKSETMNASPQGPLFGPQSRTPVPLEPAFFLVGVAGFEPTISSSRSYSESPGQTRCTLPDLGLSVSRCHRSTYYVARSRYPRSAWQCTLDGCFPTPSRGAKRAGDHVGSSLLDSSRSETDPESLTSLRPRP